MRFILAFIGVCGFQVAVAQIPRPYAPELFPENLSGAVCGFSKDGSVIYFVRENPDTKQLWLYEATRSSDRWMNEKLLPFSGKHSDLGGRFNRDRTEFYFTSDRPGGTEKADDHWNLWKVSKTENGWGEPKPLTQINSKGLECCPVPLSNGQLMYSATRDKSEWEILVDEKVLDNVSLANAWQWPSYEVKGEVLLFNSMKRSDSKGMDDIYISFWKDQKWQSPVNPGEPINTKAYEDGAILSHDGKLLIFCRHETANTPSRVMCIDATILK